MSMTPQEIVSELDKHIVGQRDAKRAVAIALRNRWRRQHHRRTLACWRLAVSKPTSFMAARRNAAS